MEINDDLFDSLAGTHKEKLAQNAKTSVSISMGTDAEQAAINQHIAKVTGLPTEVVSGNRQDVEKKLKLDAINFNDMPNTHPATAQHLANPANAAISHDDINSLLNTEACFKNDSTETLDANATYEQRQRAFQMDAIRSGQANLPGFDATGRRISGYVAPALNPDEIGHKLSAADLPGDLLASLGSGAADIGTMANYLYSRTPIGKLNNWVADKITGGNFEADTNRMLQGVQETYTGQKSLGMQEQLQAVQSADGLGGTLSALADNPAAILDQTVRQLPQIAVGGGIMRLASGTLTGARALTNMAIADLATNASMGAADAGTQAEQTVYAMTEQQLQEGSEQYRALRASGDNHENARQKVAHNAGSLAGLIAAPLSLVINKAGSHIDARFMGQLIGEQAAKLELKAALKQVVPTIAIKTLSEAADEGLSSQLSANIGVRLNANEHQDLTQGVMSSAAFGGFLGHTQGHIEAYTSILGAHVENQNKATMSERFTGFIDRLRKAAKESATQTRSPENYADFTNNSAEAQNQDLTHVYLDGKALMQSPHMKDLVAASPSIAAQYVEAVATGGAIKIPIGEYAANIANTEADTSIVEHLKQSPSAISHAEQVEFDATKDDALQQELHGAMQQLDQETAFNDSREAVKAQVLEQLQGIGSFNKKQNDAYAEAFAAHTAVRAKQLGITPEEHFKAHGVAFSKGVEANGALNQGDLNYTMQHRPPGPDDGAPIHELTFNGVYPDDVYSSNAVNYYGTGNTKMDRAAFSLANKLRGNPDAIVTIYRAVPGSVNKINAGDWVTTSKEYADAHGADGIDDVKIISEKVKAKELFTNPDSIHEFGYWPNGELFQTSNNAPRANFNPDTNQVGIFDGADLSSILHEFGHHFFENDMSIARDLITKGELSPGEIEIVQDVGALLNWLGFNGSPSEALTQWDALTFEEQRAHHEQVAESFEHYLFSGDAPTKELTRVFRMFRNMLLSAYTSIKKFLESNPSAGRLNDEVRGVFDRMLASTEQINAATQSLGLSPLFKTKEEAAQYGLDFAEYHAQNEAATDAATEEMQAKALSDMQWLHNAASKEVLRLKAEHKQQRRDTEVLARAEVLKQPIYQAIKILTDTVRTEDRVEGLDITEVKAGRIDVKSLKGVPNITKEQVTALKEKGMTRGGKINAEVMADHFGYSSTSEFVAELLSKPSLNDTVAQKTDEMLIAAHGQLPTDTAMYKAATVALHGELRSKIITAEANALAAASGSKKVTLAAVREFAGRLMNGKRIRDIRVSDYTAGEARAAKLAEDALKVADAHSYDKKIDAAKESLKAAQKALSEAVGDTKVLEKRVRTAQLRVDGLLKKQGVAKFGRVKVAAAHMREKLFHNVSAKLAIDADKFVNDSLARIKKLTSQRDKMGGEYLEQLDAFLARFDLRKSGSNKAAAAQRATLHAFITEKRREQLGLDADEAMPEVAISDDILYGTEAKPYKELTLEEFTDMVGVVDQLVMLARHEREMYRAVRNMNFAQAKEAIISKIRDIETKRGNGDKIGVDGYFNKLPPQHITTIADALDAANQKIIGEFISPENIIDLMEGGEKGVVWELLFKGMSHASDLKADMHEEAFNHFKPFLDAYSALEKAQMNQGITISGAAKIARTLGMQGVDSIVKIEGVNGENGQPLELPREKIIMVALLNGNVEGADRLSNYGWTREDIQKIVNKLTPKDCDFIESVWDYFDNKSWPKLEALNKRTLGEAPPKVIPSPFMVNGRQMTGGYMRLKYLPSETSRAQNFEDATQALTGGLTRSSKTQQGTSKERVEKLSNRPKLTLDVFSGAVSETIHDIAYREVAADTARLLNDNEIAAAIKQSVGNIPYTALRNWVRDTARPIARDMGIAEKMVNWARKRTTVNVLSGVKTALQNFTSILSPVGSGKVSFTAMSKYLALAPLRLVELSRNAKTLSGYMRHASESFERDIQEKVNGLTERGKITVIDKMAFFMMTRIDNMVRTITWSAAFHDGMAKFGNDTAAAIDHADSVTRQTLGSGRDVDLPTFYRDVNEFKRTLTMFSSFMNGQAQLLYTLGYAAKNAENKTLGTAKFATQLLGAAVLPTILSEILMHGWDDGEETPEEKAARFAWSLERYFAGMTVLRDVAAFAQSKITGGYNPGFKLSPIESQVESVAKATDVASKILNGDDISMGDERSLIMGVGFLTGTPGKIIADTITGTQAWLNDDAPPTAILTGAPRKK